MEERMTKVYTLNAVVKNTPGGVVKLLQRIQEIADFSNSIKLVRGILVRYLCGIY